MAIYPVPTTRSSDMLARSRLVSQLQGDSLEMLRLQTQLSTGRRIQLSSEDPHAALRAQSLQRLLELKAQDQTNIRTGQSYLDATDTAVGEVATLLTHARGIAVANVGTTASPAEKRAAADEIGRILQQLVATGNQQFRGRYLFAGSRLDTAPFTAENGLVAYSGNQGAIRSFADIDYLFDANINGHSMFGAISAQQQGIADLNPILTADTRLADLNSGRGITPGSIVVSDGVKSSTIDITAAHTIGDVATLIEANPPAGRTITARVGPEGLILQLDTAGGGNLTVGESGAGTTAAELGIKSNAGIGAGPLTGRDLNPIVHSTTRLADSLGVRASAIITSAGTNNDIIIESLTRGAGENGVALQFVDDALLHASPGLTAGNEAVSYSATAVAAQAAVTFSGNNNNLLLTATTAGTSLNNVQVVVESAGAIGNNATVTYDSTNKVLRLGVDSSGATQVQTLINQINAEGTFGAAYDASDPADGGFVGTAAIAAADIGSITGNTGNSGAAANTILVRVQAGQSTANQVVAALNADAMFASRFSASLDAKDTSSPSLAGRGAVDLTATGLTSGGSGEELDLASGLRIRNGENTYDIDVSGATTVEGLLNVLNGAGANILAEINASGTGINIRSRLSGADLSIGENGGTTATQLGVRSFTSSTQLSSLNYGAGIHPSGDVDFTIHRNDGVDLAINVSGAGTISDVIDLINNHPGNGDPATRVVARLAEFGNGIELVDDNPIGSNSLGITQALDSRVAEELGLVPKGTTTVTAPPASGGSPQQLTGSDVNPIEVAGVFTALIRLQSALQADDNGGIQRASALLDDAFENANFARGEVGARGQMLVRVSAHLEDENTELKKNLSDQIDVDFVKAISDLTARQAAFQASLQLSAQLQQLTLLNYL